MLCANITTCGNHGDPEIGAWYVLTRLQPNSSGEEAPVYVHLCSLNCVAQYAITNNDGTTALTLMRTGTDRRTR